MTQPCVTVLGLVSWPRFHLPVELQCLRLQQLNWMIGKFFELQVAQEILNAVRRCELPLQLDSLTEADGNCFCRQEEVLHKQHATVMEVFDCFPTTTASDTIYLIVNLIISKIIALRCQDLIFVSRGLGYGSNKISFLKVQSAHVIGLINVMQCNQFKHKIVISERLLHKSQLMNMEPQWTMSI